jgi:NADH dehydrogenase [ubiquinone] 1 alpha subcomplex assembly factor 6
MSTRTITVIFHQALSLRTASNLVRSNRSFSVSTKCSFQNRSFSVVGGQNHAGSDQKAYREEFCRSQVQKQDYDSYLIGLLLPKEYQPSFFAIRAFNIEIATIKDQIPKNTNNIARIRFQFWRDILHEMHETRKVPKHINQPVALELLDATLQYNLTVRWLERNLEARYSDVVNNGNFADYNGLEDYAEFSHSSLLYLMLETFGLRDDTAINYAASHIGVSKGIVTLLRSMPYHSSMVSLFKGV